METLRLIVATLKGEGWEQAWITLGVFIAVGFSAFVWAVVFGLVRW